MKWRENASGLHLLNLLKISAKGYRELAFPFGLFHSETYKWGIASTATRKCGTKKQTAEHLITSCPIYHHPNGTRDFLDVNKNLAMYPMETSPEIIGPSSFRASSPNKEEGNKND